MPKDTSATDSPPPGEKKKPGRLKTTVRVVGVVTITAATGVVFQSGREHGPNATRYPLLAEYTLTRSCAEEHNTFLSRKSHETLEKQCICALEKSEETVPYATLLENHATFVSAFNRAFRSCS